MLLFFDDFHVKIGQLGGVQRRKQQLMGSEIRSDQVEFGLGISHFENSMILCISGVCPDIFHQYQRDYLLRG